jgi:hypothetical protein
MAANSELEDAYCSLSNTSASAFAIFQHLRPEASLSGHLDNMERVGKKDVCIYYSF